MNAAEQVVEDRKPAPEFMLPDAEVASIKLFRLQEQGRTPKFLAYKVRSMQHRDSMVREFQNKYKDRGLAVLGVSMDEDVWETVRPFIAAHKYELPRCDCQVARRYG